MKTQKQIKDSCNLCFASYVGIILIIFALLCTGCAVTHYTPKCELMQRGEPCLTNHACCNVTYNNYDNRPYYNWWHLTRPQTNYVIVKPNKPNKPNYRPNRPNNRPKPKHRSHRK